MYNSTDRGLIGLIKGWPQPCGAMTKSVCSSIDSSSSTPEGRWMKPAYSRARLSFNCMHAFYPTQTLTYHTQVLILAILLLLWSDNVPIQTDDTLVAIMQVNS